MWWKYDPVDRERMRYKKIYSRYKVLERENEEMARSMITVTSPYPDSMDKMRHILFLRTQLTKRLSNRELLNGYFTVVELGVDYNNPHLHIQLFHRSEEERLTNLFEEFISEYDVDGLRCYISHQGLQETSRYVLKELNPFEQRSKIAERLNSWDRYKAFLGKRIRTFTFSKPGHIQEIFNFLHSEYNVKHECTAYWEKRGLIKVLPKTHSGKGYPKHFYRIPIKIESILLVNMSHLSEQIKNLLGLLSFIRPYLFQGRFYLHIYNKWRRKSSSVIERATNSDSPRAHHLFKKPHRESMTVQDRTQNVRC